MIEILEHSAAVEAPAQARAASSLAQFIRRRRAPLVGMGVVVAATMAYSLLWGPLVRGGNFWLTPGDIWGTLRSAQFVGWGDIGDVYNGGTGLVTFPGISVLLAPVALLVDHLHLSVSFPYGLIHPSAWLVLGPYEALVGSVVLIPLDALAEQLGFSRRGRLASLVVEVAILFPVLGIWGHPEDSVAMAFAVWGILAMLRGNWRSMGWLWGLALVMQPLVILMFPIVFAMTPAREWFKFALRGATPAAALVAVPLAQSWKSTTNALLKQPNFPTIDHPTPWLSLAPTLSRTRLIRSQHFYMYTKPNGSHWFAVLNSHTMGGMTVAAGPGRLIAIALSLLVGVYVWRRRPGPAQIVWFCCVALSLRCVFEAVMNPYYLWPPLAIACVLALRDWRRFAVLVVAGGALTWWSYRFIGPWEWWAPVVVLLLIVLVAAYPGQVHEETQAPRSDTGETGRRVLPESQTERVLVGR